MSTKVSELNKIKEIAREYTRKGYDVIIEPRGIDIPVFINNYAPDLIARNEEENVVIEIKRRNDIGTIEQLKDVADQINDRKGWRFELIITESKDEKNRAGKPLLEAVKIPDTEVATKEIRTLIKSEHFNAAFLLCWAYFESLSRQLLLVDNKNLKNKNTLTLIKTMFSFGYISQRDLKLLEKYFEIRNKVVHGYQAKDLDKKTIEKLLEIIEGLILLS